MNVSIPKFKVLLKKTYLYDGDPLYENSFVNAEVIGVSTYLDQTLTFHLLVQGNFLYSDMPINAFVWKIGSSNSNLTLEELGNLNCKTLPIDNFTIEALCRAKVGVYIKPTNKWVKGTYMTSFDFYTGNESLHLIKLDSGDFCLAPNHKINWSGDSELSDYKKNKQTWKI